MCSINASFREIYGLQARKDYGYVKRTKQNVDDADGTIAIRLHESGGTDSTIGWCLYKKYTRENLHSSNTGWRPVLVVDDVSPEKSAENVALIRAFVTSNKIRVLNVAGHSERSSGFPESVSFKETVKNLLVEALHPCRAKTL
eukprot:TRINITY_DN2393_c0_g1_i1.p1 TRINITY_DN2393_c0_g1~~TRINITY_DN2393_c0_g1_i1.p1  ORF type:complete len:143 (+),score=19.65 TRINITY_DN2393_c0_g1_i1:201-629(+)